MNNNQDQNQNNPGPAGATDRLVHFSVGLNVIIFGVYCLYCYLRELGKISAETYSHMLNPGVPYALLLIGLFHATRYIVRRRARRSH